MARKAGIVFVVLLFAVSIAYWRLTESPPERPIEQPTDAKLDDEADRMRKMTAGIWQDEYQGKRTMTLKPDGAGIMVVELTGFQATLMGPKLRFDMTWRIDDKKLIKRTIGGEPASKVNLILNTMGDTAEDTILELTPDRMLLLDKNGKTRYDWKRVLE